MSGPSHRRCPSCWPSITSSPLDRENSKTRLPPFKRRLTNFSWILLFGLLVSSIFVGVTFFLYHPSELSAHFTQPPLPSAADTTPDIRPWSVDPLEPHTMSDADLFSHVLQLPVVERPQKRGQEKIAFMFLTRGPLPLAPLWARYFHGHQWLYSVYIHASGATSYGPHDLPPMFQQRVIPSQAVQWGDASMVNAERRLLANALLDAKNHHFVLLSESCVPLYNLTYAHWYMTASDTSFVTISVDEREEITYKPTMMPEVKREEWKKGDEWKVLQRRTAMQVIGDTKYYDKFAAHCVPPACDPFVYGYMDERFIPSLLYIKDPSVLANRTLTYSDWVQHDNWAHPHTFMVKEITVDVLERIRNQTWNIPFVLRKEQGSECRMNGLQVVPCYLFARKFPKDTLSALLAVARDLEL